MKKLIRNGGFERGTIDFWKAFDEQNFYVQNGYTHEGSYAGRLDCDGTHEPYIMSNDYISLVTGETAYFEAWLYANGTYAAEIDVVYYDEGLVAIKEVQYETFNPGTVIFNQALLAIPGIDGAIYARPKIKLNHATLNDFMVIDSVMMYKFEPNAIIGGERLMAKFDNIAMTGNFNGDWMLSAPFKEAEFKLYVPSCAGTSETLDVSVVSRESFGEADHEIATFTQVTGPNDLQVLLVTAGLGTKIRVEAVVGGNPTDIDFYVVAIFKR